MVNLCVYGGGECCEIVCVGLGLSECVEGLSVVRECMWKSFVLLRGKVCGEG